MATLTKRKGRKEKKKKTYIRNLEDGSTVPFLNPFLYARINDTANENTDMKEQARPTFFEPRTILAHQKYLRIKQKNTAVKPYFFIVTSLYDSPISEFLKLFVYGTSSLMILAYRKRSDL